MKKVFRKIHLWLSVPFGIIITLICFSGATMVFEKEITELVDPHTYFVNEVKDQALPLSEIAEQVAATLPDSVSITGITVWPDPERTYQVSLSKPRRASLYVDPYTGQITGNGGKLPFFNTMFHLHRWLLGSSTGAGKVIVGITVIVMILIIITGLLMWLTNRNKPLTKSLKISVRHGLPRFWHDLHVAGGIYSTIFVLALALTGLTWSFTWYSNGFYSLFGVEATAHGGNRGGAAHGSHRGGHGEGRGEGRGESGYRGGHGEVSEGDEARQRHHHHEEGDFSGEHAHHFGGHRHSPYRHWQKTLDKLIADNPGYQAITLQEGAASVVTAGRRSMRATDNYTVDPRSGLITSVVTYDQQEKAGKVRSAVYMVHVGSWGGIITRIITFIAVLIATTLPLTGYYLWIRRLIRKRQNKMPKA
ncbi:MAG: PepSY-associated TM helix domain-containing protein [Muribaculaceae bacterium]